jgi:hypothetical protein
MESQISHRQEASQTRLRGFLRRMYHIEPGCPSNQGRIPDSDILGCTVIISVQANSTYLFIPLAGAGGPLGVHSLDKKGRLPTRLPAFSSGSALVSFELDPFDRSKAYVAGDDGKIRIFEVPRDGFPKDNVDSAPAVILEGREHLASAYECWVSLTGYTDPKMDRLVILRAHPTSQDVLLSVSDDFGHAVLRVWDVAQRTAALHVSIGKHSVCRSYCLLKTSSLNGLGA